MNSKSGSRSLATKHDRRRDPASLKKAALAPFVDRLAARNSQQVFIYFYFDIETTPFIPKGYVAKEREKEKEGQRPSSIGPLKHRRSVTLHSALCARLGGRSTPLQSRDEKKKRQEQFSHLLHAPPPLRSPTQPTHPS